MDILENLFGSALKVRVIRALINNPDSFFDLKTFSKKVKASRASTKKEVLLLEKIKLVRRKDIRDKNGKKVSGCVLNHNFKHILAFREFLMNVSPLTEDAIAKKLGDKGKAKLVVISGMFLDSKDSRADMLVVSEKANDRKVNRIIADIGAEFGRDVSYALFTKDDFTYRRGMGDKLIRDIFDFPHKIILDKIGLNGK